MAEDAVATIQGTLDLKTLDGQCRSVHSIWRARTLAGRPGMTTSTLVARLLLEQSIVGTYVADRLAHLLSGRPEDGVLAPLQHLDLDEMSQVLSTPNARLHEAIRAEYTEFRRRLVPQIVWEAAGSDGRDGREDKLWVMNPALALDEFALHEVFDRRLRAVERMVFNVNPPPYNVALAERHWNTSDRSWPDGLRMRLFEYPSVPATPAFNQLLEGLSDWTLVDGSWAYTPRGTLKIWIPDDLLPSGSIAPLPPSFYSIALLGSERSQTIRRLFSTPRVGFRNRVWMMCDHVGSAVSIEALWFGLGRRRNNVRALDSAFPGKGGDYVRLGPVLRHYWTVDDNYLMNDGDDDKYFENTRVPLDELQIGDLTVFVSSQIYELLLGGPWRNEWCLVVGIERHADTGKVQVGGTPRITLSGHGLSGSYATMAAAIVEELRQTLLLVYGTILRIVEEHPSIHGIQHIAENGDPVNLVRWDPYGGFEHPGAWWIAIPYSAWHDKWGYPSWQEAMAGIPRTVHHAFAMGGVGYQAPGDTSALFFPLTQPMGTTAQPTTDTWRPYLEHHRANQPYAVSPRLAAFLVDSSMVTGLYSRGVGASIAVVRPRIRKTL